MSGFPSYAQLSEADLSGLADRLRAATPEVERKEPGEWPFAWQWRAWEAIGGALSAAVVRRGSARSGPQGVVRRPAAAELPAWVSRSARAVVTVLAERWPQDAAFHEVRTLHRLGLVDLAVDDDYVLAMVSALGSRRDPEPRLTGLREDPELVATAFWRVFEVEGGGEVSLANVDKFSDGGCDWQTAVRALVAEGTLPRDRVLRSCVEALSRDFSAYRAGWFSRLYEALDPSAAESAADQVLLAGLLRSGIGASVTVAARRLTAVQKAGLLEARPVVAAAPAAPAVASKASAAALLTLLQRATDTVPVVEVAGAVGWFCEHRHPEVQAAALRLLTGWQADDVIASHREALPPSLAGQVRAGAGPPETDVRATVPFPVDVGWPEIVPMTVEDMAERTAVVLEGQAGLTEVELLLAALAALDADAVAARLRPVHKRAAAILRRQEPDDPTYVTGAAALAALVLAAAGDPAPVSVPRGARSRPTPDAFTRRRLDEVTRLARAGSRPLLATPTEPGLLVGADALVARLWALAEAGLDVPRHDLVCALLRLGPGGRDEALRLALGLPGEAGAVVRYALGGTAERAPTTSAWWVAAGRARDPFGDDPWLTARGLDRPGQGPAARLRVELTQGSDRYWQTTLVCDTEAPPPPAGAERFPADQPTLQARRLVADGFWAPGWFVSAAGITPLDLDQGIGVGVAHLVGAVHPYSGVDYEVPELIDLLAEHPGRPGPVTADALALALGARSADHRMRAVEAFSCLVVRPGRLTPEDLAAGLARVSGPCTATRWAASLTDAAAAGHHAGATVVRTLTHLLPQLPTTYRRVDALLTLLHEETLRTGTPIDDPTLRHWLERIGTGRAATTARALLITAAGAAT